MSDDQMNRDDCTAMVQAAYRDGIKYGRENRWAAFTDDELAALDSILTDYLGDWDSITWNEEAIALLAEIKAELSRRNADGS